MGVRIAVRDVVQGQDHLPESQIYNWGIKKGTSLDGEQPGISASSPGVSSDVPSMDSIPQTAQDVNPELAQKEGKSGYVSPDPLVRAMMGQGQKSATDGVAVDPGARISIREDMGEMPSAGYKVPHISMPMEALQGEDGSQVPESKIPAAIRKYMIKLFRGKVLNIGADHKAYISKDGVEEFAFPVRRMDPKTKMAKMAAGVNLDTTLAPTETGLYSGIIKTMVTKRGREFYDITEIQKEGEPTTRGDNGTNPAAR